MNQAEILIHAFKHYYLKRASWKSQEEFRTHVMASWPEYNHRWLMSGNWCDCQALAQRDGPPSPQVFTRRADAGRVGPARRGFTLHCHHLPDMSRRGKLTAPETIGS